MSGRFFLLVILLFIYLQGNSQTEIKFGKLSKEEKEYQHCDYDPEAEAVFLQYLGNIEVNYAGVVIEKHIRIKILNDKGMDYANVSLPFYSKDGFEKITQIKAQTLNRNEKGNLESYEIDKKEFYEIELSEDWSEMRFTFPNVRPGSILEYKYRVVSDNFLYLDKWDFQHELPTIHTSLQVRIPEYLEYRVLIQGYRLMEKYRDNIGNAWELENLPTIKKEPYLYNIQDYTEKVKFQLSAYHEKQAYSGGYERKSLLKNWDDLAFEVITSWPFTSYISKKGFARDILERLHLSDISDKEKMEAIYNYVKNTYQWNGGYRRSTYNKFSDFTDSKTGYSSEVNLLLTLLLTEGGLDASPMLISTRSNGISSSNNTFLSQFDHIITRVNLNDTIHYLDATDPFRPLSMLSVESNVNQGFILDKKKPQWEEINNNVSSSTYYSFLIHIKDDQCEAQANISAIGYPAVSLRKELFSGSKGKWLGKKIIHDISIEEDSITVKSLKEVDQPIELKGNFSYKIVRQNNMIYLNPYIIRELKENPFKNDSRYYPVQFPYTEKISYRANFIIPEGYEVVEAPESQRVRLPNGYGSFIYAVSQFENSITIQIVYNLDKYEIPSNQYQNLREYFSIIVSKLDQQIVLREMK